MLEAQRVATAAASRLGLSRLKALLLGEYARWSTNFRNYLKVQAEILKLTGWAPHRDSIGRATRQLRDDGFLIHKRVAPGVVPTSADYRTNGTTEKTVVWRVLQVKNPLTRSQRRAARIEQAREMRVVERERRRKERDAEVSFVKRLAADLPPPPERPHAPTYQEQIEALANAGRAGQARLRAAAACQRRPGRVDGSEGDGAGPVLVPPPSAIGPPE